MTDDVRGWRGDDAGVRRREFDEGSRRREFDDGVRREFDDRARRRESALERAWSDNSDRPYADGDYGWRGERREYEWPDAAMYPGRTSVGSREASINRDYSGMSWGLTGGHRQDRDVYRTGAGIEAGYANFHRPDAPHRASVDRWRAPGPHAGRGLRGYQRSDHRIREDVNDRLTAHGWIDATDIECKVENCEVLLTGFVDSRAAKRVAEDVAESVDGVREVHNHLRIRTSAADHEGVGRTSVLGLTESQTQTQDYEPAERGRSRTRS